MEQEKVVKDTKDIGAQFKNLKVTEIPNTFRTKLESTRA